MRTILVVEQVKQSKGYVKNHTRHEMKQYFINALDGFNKQNIFTTESSNSSNVTKRLKKIASRFQGQVAIIDCRKGQTTKQAIDWKLIPHNNVTSK